jgi:nucleotide-binding universal stress UspA family protein
MPLKDIFLHAGSDDHYRSRLDVAIELAAEHKAHLTAVYVPTLPKELGRTRAVAHPAVPGELLGISSRRAPRTNRKQQMIDAAYERVRDLSETARELFRDEAERARVSHHWVYDEAPLLDALALHARFCDVLVITQPTEKNLTDHPILTLGLPVLQVPNNGEPRKKVGERIMIAWDRSPVALRAVNNARPFLREAAEVKVLSVNLEPIYRGAVAGSGIIEHLARHGIKATRLRVTGEDSRLSDVILATARQEGSDLIVMGAFGKRRLRHRILGGVTTHVVADTTVPLLLTH